MVKFLEKYSVAKFTQKEMENLNSSVTIKATEFNNQKLSYKKNSRPRLLHRQIQGRSNSNFT